jgi:outer membrane receptor protein involved in Fe transport
VRSADLFAGLSLLCLAAAPANAAERISIRIPAGPLADALIKLAEQARITIGATDPTLRTVQSRGVHGSMTVAQAFDRLLAGTRFRAEVVAAGTFRIVERPGQATKPAPPKVASVQRRPAVPDTDNSEIIVTGSKQGTSLSRFGGTVQIASLELTDTGRKGARGSEMLMEQLPMLTATSLGAGRNKLYIRGVADSSFNGPSQSVVGQYLGDVRLTFNAPDPNLHLYDMGRAELLEGPQGTLYGSGSLGGILRLVPNPPDPSKAEAAVAGGVLATHKGEMGTEASGMLNLPLSSAVTMRAVGYDAVDPAYIDDAQRGLKDINRTVTRGGRADVLIQPGNGWELNVGGVLQYISSRDGQYAEEGLPPLTRRSNLPQPFENDYALGYFTLRKRWDAVELVAATDIVRHSLESQFDATGFEGTSAPQLFREERGITLISNETRLSQLDSKGEGWVVGVGLLHDMDRLSRSLGPPDARLPLTGVRNTTDEAALFGQYSVRLTPNLVATAGGRLAYSSEKGSTLDDRNRKDQPEREDVRVLPTAAVTWHHDNMLVYARYQEGFRAGGLAVSASGSSTTAQRFESDNLSSYEIGLRLGRPDGRFALALAASYADWEDIQADLIDLRGLPYTANIGSGYIRSIEASADYRPASDLQLSFSLFLDQSALSSPAPGFEEADQRDLPNIARAGAHLGVTYDKALSSRLRMQLNGSLRYVGESQLGIGPPLDQDQGQYLEADVGARLAIRNFGLSLDITNLADVRANRFSFGNPFSLDQRSQITPLRPRTIRLGLDAHF